MLNLNSIKQCERVVMKGDKVQNIRVSFPGNLGYVSAIRKLVTDLLQANDYSRKFAYRSEVIVDEVCSNAIQYGCKKENSSIELSCSISEESFEIQVKDEGGEVTDINKLKSAVNSEISDIDLEVSRIRKFARGGFGLEIVRMLSEEIELKIGENNMTTLRVVRKKSQDG